MYALMRCWAAMSITGGTSVPKSAAGPTLSVSMAPARRSASSSATAWCTSAREAAEHFWPANAKADFSRPGTTSSRSASESTMTQFLPPISAITRLMWRWPGTTLAASRGCSARGAGAGEDDRVDARVGDQRLAGLVAAGEQRQRVERDAAGVQRVDDGLRARGACSAGFSTTALPVASAAETIRRRSPAGSSTARSRP